MQTHYHRTHASAQDPARAVDRFHPLHRPPPHADATPKQLVPPRYIVDAMNVIGSRPDKWWNDPDEAMRKFAEKVEAHAVATGKDITVVFDKDPGRLPAPEQIEVVFARRRGRDAADYEIAQLVKADDHPESLRVVTSDKRLIDEVTQSGAQVISAGRFRDELDA